jgi:predicted TPR repeat methyltransferase
MTNSCHDAAEQRARAFAHFRSGELDLAAQLLERLVAAAPADVQAWNLLGAVYGTQGRNSDCEHACRKVLVLHPGAYSTWNNLGNALKNQGRMEEARAAYQQALAIQPGHAEALNNLGNLERECGNADGARHLFLEALRLRPDYAQAHNNLGNVYRDAGERETAARSYAEALRLQPAYPDALINLGILYQLNEQLPQAGHCYEQALALRPNHADTHFNLGMVRQMQGKQGPARECFLRALALDPNHGNARYFLSSIDGRDVPPSAPTRYVTELFDTYAERFDEHLVTHLHYHIPEQLFVLARRHLAGTPRLNMLDLGCGTGLSGAAFREVCGHMTGVDLSPKMITRARARGIYDTLHVADLAAVLRAVPGQFDLVVATDVFIYIGDIREIFSLTRSALQAGGWFCFSVECCDREQDYVLRTSGRYAQSPAYIERLAGSTGFSILECTAATIRMERGDAIPGNMYVLRSTEAAA